VSGHRTGKTPEWVSEPLVACVDGPMAGQWYTAADWSERLATAERMTERGQRRSPVLDYVRTGATVAHPHQDEASGGAWNHQPTTVPAMSPRPLTTAAGETTAGGPFRVLITGSRTWDRVEDVTTALDELRERLGPDRRLTLVHGACPTGADQIADDWARGHQADVSVERHRADWSTHQRAAGPIRNAGMVEAGADLCLAFIRDDSPGATGCTRMALAANIPTDARTYPDEPTTSSDHHEPADRAELVLEPPPLDDCDGWSW
jgi:hypothetical protein